MNKRNEFVFSETQAHLLNKYSTLVFAHNSTDNALSYGILTSDALTLFASADNYYKNKTVALHTYSLID